MKQNKSVVLMEHLFYLRAHENTQSAIVRKIQDKKKDSYVICSTVKHISNSNTFFSTLKNDRFILFKNIFYNSSSNCSGAKLAVNAPPPPPNVVLSFGCLGYTLLYKFIHTVSCCAVGWLNIHFIEPCKPTDCLVWPVKLKKIDVKTKKVELIIVVTVW